MKATFAVDVLICGAGAAGLTLAIELARRGISFHLIEKMQQPFHGSRGKGIQPRTQEVFEDMGIIDRIAAAGGVYPPERRYATDGSYSQGSGVEHASATPAEPFRTALMLPQFITESILRERLVELGHAPEFGCVLLGFEQDDAGVSAQLSGRSGLHALRARWLVGADGGRSFVRHSLDIGFPGKTLGVRALVADVTLTGLSRDHWHRFGEGDLSQQLSLCPLAGTDLFQVQAPVAPEGEINLAPEGLSTLVASRTGRDDIAISSVAWASVYTMNARLADHYRVGRVFLVGDAAHIHPPTGGQGLNTSVQDAYNLGWKLSAVIKGAPAALLDSYEQERRPVAASVLGLSTRLLDSHARGDSRRGREVQQLDIGYPDSMLAPQHAKRSGLPAAGDRASDAPVRLAGGHTCRLFNLFRGPHWTLLGFGTDHSAVAPRAGLHIHHIGARGDVIDENNHFTDAYQPAMGDWVLVRPDGYIGIIVGELDSLERYLAEVGLARPAVNR